jgi:large subunit ribosomal protein L21
VHQLLFKNYLKLFKKMFCRFLRTAQARCLSQHIFSASKTGPPVETGLRFIRSVSPNFPVRFLRKPEISALSPAQQAQEECEVATEDQDKTEEVWSMVNDQIESNNYGRLFVVAMLGWHQHKLTAGDVLMVNHDVGAKPGQKIKLEKILLVGSKDFTLIGRPLLPRDLLSVEATVVEKNLSQTKICQKFRKRQSYLRHYYKREFQTTLRINHIEIVKKVNQTEDRAGFEPPSNTNPLANI